MYELVKVMAAVLRLEGRCPENCEPQECLRTVSLCYPCMSKYVSSTLFKAPGWFINSTRFIFSPLLLNVSWIIQPVQSTGWCQAGRLSCTRSPTFDRFLANRGQYWNCFTLEWIFATIWIVLSLHISLQLSAVPFYTFFFWSVSMVIL